MPATETFAACRGDDAPRRRAGDGGERASTSCSSRCRGPSWARSASTACSPSGRAEQPFATYEDDFVVMLSRRHARIFCEAGVVYVADLESSNGTTVNRAAVGQSPCPLRDGDEICFGGVLSYRVEITPRTKARPDAVHPDALARLRGLGPGDARHHALSFPRQQDRRRRSPANAASMPRS